MKSHESDLVDVAAAVFKDVAAKCAADQQRDLETLRSRVEHEGMSFLTITLPTFGKDFERSLSLGRVEPTLFASFAKSGRIPAFLQGIVAQVFDHATGGILDDPNIAAIEGVRQVAYLFKKLNVPCSPKRTRAALDEFQQIEQIFDEAPDHRSYEYFTCVSDCLWSNVFSSGLPEVCTLIPKHGPGATRERISGNAKYVHKRWHDRLESFFPMLHWCFSSENAFESEEFESLQVVPEEQEEPVRVIPVPKTLKTPRIIAIEPVCMQYTQQALSKALVKVLERSPITQGQINFTDQSVNRDLAMKSSADGYLATLDLSSASDRVPYSLAIRMFDSVPDFRDAVSACRSKSAQMPDGELVPLRKFASMGSALCFPVESMYFYTVCVAALLDRHDLPVNLRNILKMTRRVHVYGDDIIVPADEAAHVISYLQKYYCKVNAGKSFWTGKFRESCGMDAYDGEEVTPTYLRQMPPNDTRNSRELISWVETSNLFYIKGYWNVAALLMSRVESILGKLPIMGPRASGLGKVSFQHLVSAGRWDRKHQCLKVRAWCPVPVYQNDELGGYSALMKSLLMLETSKETLTQSDHLMKTVRFGAVALKRRWILPY